MKRLGILIGYAPHEALRKEGLGRLLAFILKGIVESSKVRPVVVAPHWYRDIVLDLLDDHDIDPKAIELITTRQVPVLMRIAQWRGLVPRGEEEKNIRAEAGGWRKSIEDTVGSVGSALEDLRVRLWSTSGLAVIPIIFVSVLIILPVVSVAAAAFLLFRGLRLALRHAFRLARYVLRPLRGTVAKAIEQLFFTGVGTRLYTEMVRREVMQVVRLANATKDVQGWYIPSMFWPEIRFLKARRVMAGPDMVFVRFPTFFNFPLSLGVYDRVANSLAAADHIISYSQFVADENLAKIALVEKSRVSIVPHGRTELSEYLESDNKDDQYKTQKAKRIIAEYQISAMWSNAYWRTTDLWSIDYIIYASQNRPYKNIINLVRAVEEVRRYGKDVRIILTARFDNSPLGDYISENQLENIVWSAHDVSTKVLSALNYFARCSVNPTLFEGGFPFTFTEAYSVGAPSVMSRIPMTIERISDTNLADIMLFDPHDIDDMAAKIVYACDNRERLMALQKPLYDSFESWEAVAQRYIKIISGEGMPPVVRRKIKKLKRRPPRDRFMVD